MITDVFHALSDPIRIEMVSRLSAGEAVTLGTLSSNLGVTRQGARKHIQVLAEAEIIYLRKKGRSTQAQLNPRSLAKVRDFISRLEDQWDERLLALRDFVEGRESEV